MRTPAPDPRPHALPPWARRLLLRLAPWHNRDVVLGDFAEIYQYIAAEEGRGRALRWFAGQVLRSTPAFLANGFSYRSVMVGNYVKIAFRNLLKRKFYSALNIGGLAIGMAACLLIFQYVAYEYSYDDFHEYGDDLYRATVASYQNGAADGTTVYSWFGLAPALAADLPEVAAAARYHPNYGPATIAYTDAAGTRQAVRVDGLSFADPSLLSLFTFPLHTGDAATALTAPRTMLISASKAQQFFGSADPIGQVLDVRAWTSAPYTIVGVLKDGPATTHLQFDFLLPLEDLLQDEDGQYAGADGWGWSNFVTYVRLRPGADAQAAAAGMTNVVMTHKADAARESNRRFDVGLQPVADIHLGSEFDENFITPGSSYRTVYFFSLVALFILVMAWVNYINLSTARALERAKEVGVRKVAGARKGQLISQFVTESVLVNAVALGLALGLAVLALPTLNALAGTAISPDAWWTPRLWVVLLALFGLGAVLASLYPAFVLSAFRPATVLKGQGTAGGGTLFRQALVVFQFAASIALLTGTYVVYMQVKHLRSADLGVDIERMLVVSRPTFIDDGDQYRADRAVFKEELARLPGVTHVTGSSTVPGGGFSLGTTFHRAGAPSSAQQPVNVSWINDDFVATYGLEVVAGRDFSGDLTTDGSDAVLINETAAQKLGFDAPGDAVGASIMLGGGDTARQVAGVLADFHWMSAKQAIDPAVFMPSQGGRYFSVKMRTDDLAATLAGVRAVYDRVFPGNPYEAFFADQFFAAQYEADRRFGTLFGLFALFALLVAGLGLVGLAAFTTARRTKEIGIRKALGARTPGLIRLLLKDVVRLIAVALVVTAPLVYLAAEAWLASFADPMALGVWLFVGPALVVLLFALLTVSYHTLKTALADPVQSLRYD